jgi:hypothetical protein
MCDLEISVNDLVTMAVFDCVQHLVQDLAVNTKNRVRVSANSRSWTPPCFVFFKMPMSNDIVEQLAARRKFQNDVHRFRGVYHLVASAK